MQVSNNMFKKKIKNKMKQDIKKVIMNNNMKENNNYLIIILNKIYNIKKKDIQIIKEFQNKMLNKIYKMKIMPKNTLLKLIIKLKMLKNMNSSKYHKVIHKMNKYHKNNINQTPQQIKLIFLYQNLLFNQLNNLLNKSQFNPLPNNKYNLLINSKCNFLLNNKYNLLFNNQDNLPFNNQENHFLNHKLNQEYPNKVINNQ